MSTLRNRIPTKPSPWARLCLALRAAYLRILIRSCEQDIEFHAHMAELEPKLKQLAERRRDCLLVQLSDCELGARIR